MNGTALVLALVVAIVLTGAAAAGVALGTAGANRHRSGDLTTRTAPRPRYGHDPTSCPFCTHDDSGRFRSD